MDNSFDEMEDNIRPPDEVIREQLIEDTRSDFQKEMDQAFLASIEEFKKQDKDVRILTSFAVSKCYNKSYWSKILSTNQVQQDSPPGQAGWHRRGERSDPISVTGRWILINSNHYFLHLTSFI